MKYTFGSAWVIVAVILPGVAQATALPHQLKPAAWQEQDDRQQRDDDDARRRDHDRRNDRDDDRDRRDWRQYHGVLAPEWQAKFDSYYSRWLNYRARNDRDEMASMEGRMRDIMNHYNIPLDVPYDAIASRGRHRDHD